MNATAALPIVGVDLAKSVFQLAIPLCQYK
jgi:hypothetical protein